MAIPLDRGSDDDFYIVPEAFVYDYDKMFQYGWFTISLLLATWAFATGVETVLPKVEYLDIGTKYRLLSIDKKKNTVTYVMQIIMTTFALACQIYGGWEVVFQFKDETSRSRMDWLVFAIQLLVVLYVWEILYRLTIGLPLLVHHLMAVLITQLAVASYLDSGDMFYARFLCMFGWHATTEQLSFVVLFMFRLDLFPSWQASLFHAAATQTLMLKIIITIAMTALVITEAFINNEDDAMGWIWFWRIAYLPITIVVFGSQMYAVNVLYALSARCRKMARNMTSNESDIESGDMGLTSTDSSCQCPNGKSHHSAKAEHPTATSSPRASSGRRRSSINRSFRTADPQEHDSRRRGSDIILASYESSAAPEEMMLDDFRAQQSVRLALLRKTVSSRSNAGTTAATHVRRSRPIVEIAWILSQLEKELEMGMAVGVGEEDSEEEHDHHVGCDTSETGLSPSDLARIERLCGRKPGSARESAVTSRQLTVSHVGKVIDSTAKTSRISREDFDVEKNGRC